MYNGVCIILNRPSRFDVEHKKLFSGNAGMWFLEFLKRLGINYTDCHVSTADKFTEVLPNTKIILALGEASLKLFKGDEVTLGEQRGSPFLYRDTHIPVIATYCPQDCFDPQDYENRYWNKVNYTAEEESDKDDDTDTGKAHGKTRRSNYRFWTTKDLQKLSRLLKDGLHIIEPKLEFFPSADEIIYDLTTEKNKDFYIDIEIDPETLDITVFSYCFLDPNDYETIPHVKIVPCRRYNYTRAYENLPKIFVSLAVAMRDNTTVHHNGSCFDIWVISYKYRIPFGIRHFDTMDSHHRNHLEVEKSLGHAISLYTDLFYHKNSAGTFTPHNTHQEMNLWRYNGIDTFAMVYVKRGILRYAEKIGSISSIEQTNMATYPYLMLTFMGIRTNQEAAQLKIDENDKRINQYLRILNTLIGRKVNPRSNKDIPHYLFGKKDEGGLGLKPVGYTKAFKPAADGKALIKLFVNNPQIVTLRLILEIRRIQKESEALIYKAITW